MVVETLEELVDYNLPEILQERPSHLDLLLNLNELYNLYNTLPNRNVETTSRILDEENE